MWQSTYSRSLSSRDTISSRVTLHGSQLGKQGHQLIQCFRIHQSSNTVLLLIIDDYAECQMLTKFEKACLKIFRELWVCLQRFRFRKLVLLTPAPAGPGDPGVPASPRDPWAPSAPRAPVGPASPWGENGQNRAQSQKRVTELHREGIQEDALTFHDYARH